MTTTESDTTDSTDSPAETAHAEGGADGRGSWPGAAVATVATAVSNPIGPSPRTPAMQRIFMMARFDGPARGPPRGPAGTTVRYQ